LLMRLSRLFLLSFRTFYTAKANVRRMRVETDGNTGTVTHYPNDGQQSASVILMHGLGDSGEGLSDIAAEWGKLMPHIKFILPTADQRTVTLNGGVRMSAWYDIVGIDDRAAESCDGIHDSVERVKTILANEHSNGVPYSRMALAGFSQGGAMSLFTGLQLPADQKLAGLLVMSGYLPGASQFKVTAGLENVPILHCHGSADPVVIPLWATKTQSGLKEKGLVNYELKTYSGLGHSINMDVLRDASVFLSTILPPDEQYNIKPKPPSEMTVKELKASIRNNGLNSKAIGFNEKHEFVKLLEDFYASK
jgi:lysophospholipase-2